MALALPATRLVRVSNIESTRTEAATKTPNLVVLATCALVGVLSLVAQTPAAQAAPRDAELPSIDVESYSLSNGLTVLLSRGQRLPVVAVEVRYLVGSAHERPGRSGFAHLFEHLMFQGSRSYDDEYFKPFEPIGAIVNGSTNTDRTNYYERVPSSYLELALWMESDRMEGLLDALTQEKLDNQRDVVKNERRQRYENSPYGMVWKHLANALHPPGHPYHHTTIGSHEDLSAATLDDVKEFFATYYVPSNAVLTIVGDFEPSEAKALVDRYFGHLPAGQRASMPVPPRLVQRGAHIIDPDNVQLPRIHLAWNTPALFADGDAALDVLAGVLSTGKTSRLSQSLVYEQKVAKDVVAYQVSRALGSFFVVQATAAPGVSVDVLSQALQAQLAAALDKPPSADEMARVVNQWRKSFYEQIEGVLSRAQLLSTYYAMTGDPDYIAEDLARYTTLTAADVHHHAKRWLDLERAVRIDMVPAGQQGTTR